MTEVSAHSHTGLHRFTCPCAAEPGSNRHILSVRGQIKRGIGIRTKPEKWLVITSIFLGGLGVLLGISFIFMYVWEAVISRLGEPDQSLLFWYLPIMFLGIAVGGGGFSLLVFGLKTMKTTRGRRS